MRYFSRSGISRFRHNPTLAVFANPPRQRWSSAGELSREAIEIRYIHAEDGKAYKHTFGPDVCIECLSDGSVRIYGKYNQPVWGDF